VEYDIKVIQYRLKLQLLQTDHMVT